MSSKSITDRWKGKKARPEGVVGARWFARYRDNAGKEHAKRFEKKDDAQAWLDTETAKLVTGTWIDPRTAKTTVAAWCEKWLATYAVNRDSTVRQAATHVKRIVEYFGDRPLASIAPSDVKAWVVTLQADGLAVSTVYALHGRLAQILGDAVLDKVIPSSPCSRRTSPPAPKQIPHLATTEQVWALHDAIGETFRPAVLLAAFAGLRLGEVAALRVEDVDFMRGVIHPKIQYPDRPLKTESSRWPIPIPRELVVELNRNPTQRGSSTIVVGAFGRPVSNHTVYEAFRLACEQVPGLPAGFRFHDLRHYYASFLIHSGLDVKTVQRRLRHASAKVTLDTYGHLWPDTDETTRAAVSALFAGKTAAPAVSLRSVGESR